MEEVSNLDPAVDQWILDGYLVVAECPTPPKPDFVRYGALRCHSDDECQKLNPGCECRLFVRRKREGLSPKDGWRHAGLVGTMGQDEEAKCFCVDSVTRSRSTEPGTSEGATRT